MSMRIQEAFSNCCEGVKEFASSAANWISKSVAAGGAFMSETAAKVAEFVRPQFEQLSTFARANQDSLIIGGIAFAIGAIATAILTNVFYRGTNTTPAEVPVAGTPAPVPT